MRSGFQWAIGCVLFIGCASHIHGPTDQKRAEDAKQRLAELVAAQSSTFAALKHNVELFARVEREAFDDTLASTLATTSEVLARISWKQLRSRFAQQQELLSTEVVPDLAKRIAAINAELGDTATMSEGQQADLAAAEGNLSEAKARASTWSRRVAVLNAFIEHTPTAFALGQSDGAEGLRKAILEAKDKPIRYLDADGSEFETTLQAEVELLLEVALAESTGDSESDNLVKGFELLVPKSPGLIVTTTSLARDLAEAQLQRTESRTGSLQQRLVLARRAEELRIKAEELLANGASLIADEAVFAPEEQVVVGFGRYARNQLEVSSTEEAARRAAAALEAAQQAGDDGAIGRARAEADAASALLAEQNANAADRIDAAYLALQDYVQAAPLVQEILALDREDVVLRHLQSIEESRIAANEHLVLLARGTEGLLNYHSGGVKPEELAEMVYWVAQLGALGIIAGQTE